MPALSTGNAAAGTRMYCLAPRSSGFASAFASELLNTRQYEGGWHNLLVPKNA